MSCRASATIRVRFYGTQDSLLQTSFLIDDIAPKRFSNQTGGGSRMSAVNKEER
jgi:hypothetical protein